MIENTLERIAVALEKIAAGYGAIALNGPAIEPAFNIPANDADRVARKTTKKAKVETAAIPAPAPAAEVTRTKDDVTDVLREVVAKKGPNAAREVLAGLGATRISELSEDQYAEAFDQLSGVLNG